MNRKTKRIQPIDSDSASSIIPIKKKKISVVKLSTQEKRIVLPDCKPSIWNFKLIYIFLLSLFLKYKV